ncbi:hypothetical protein F2Q68_00024021 [Brassica cretica]|uniref:Protein kinase domain-containing protein n=1 Tax=Brassica cretica TaxID=69181 RepID=A0A8S9IA76_BRACR|nr:hypothetical protein F2Q68_00024021 [Brassica cretica]
MSRPHDPPRGFFPFGNPFRMLSPKSSALSPWLLSLLTGFELLLAERLKKLIPKNKDDILTLSWMKLAMESLCETHKNINTLITDLHLPVSDWEEKWVDVYLDISVKLLDLCNAFSSELTRLNQGDLYLKCVLHSLQSGSGEKKYLQSRSSLDSWRQHVNANNARIETCREVLDCLAKSLTLPRVKSSAKGKVLMRAFYGVKVQTVYICSVFTAAWSDSTEDLFDLHVSEKPLWAKVFTDMQSVVNGEIRDLLLSSGRSTILKELERVDASVEKLYPMIQDGVDDPVEVETFKDCVMELGIQAEKLSQGLDQLLEEVESFFKMILSGRDVLLCNLRSSDLISGNVLGEDVVPSVELVSLVSSVLALSVLIELSSAVIAIKDIVRPPQRDVFNDVYIVYELMDTDLQRVLHSKQTLSHDQCRLLRGLKYVHSANILHRDLRPSNVLLNSKHELKIGDFGLARTTSDTDFMTEYVVTRWYRAPELLLNCSEYTAAIDIWSVGCIFGEIMTGQPLFPGKDYVHQLRLITELVGSPDNSSLGFLRSDNARRYVRQLPRYPKQEFAARFPKMPPTAIDLLERMLVFDPNRRISVDEALGHAYLSPHHDVAKEPVCPTPFSFDFEHPSCTEEHIKELIYKESVKFNPDH